MSALYPGYFPEAGPTPAAPPQPWVTRDDVRAAAYVVALLAVVGAVLGAVWELWSRHSSQLGSRGFVTASGVIPDEKEGFIAGDARFVILTGAVGLIAGLIAWRWRERRGPLMPVALAVGGLLGAALTAVVGHALAAGRTGGPANSVIVIKLSLHAYGLGMIEAVLALLVYLVGVLVIKPDDLGRPVS